MALKWDWCRIDGRRCILCLVSCESHKMICIWICVPFESPLFVINGLYQFTHNLLNLLLMMRFTERDEGSNSKQSLVSSSSFSSFNSTLVYLHTSNGKNLILYIFFQLLPTLCSDKQFHPLRIIKNAAHANQLKKEENKATNLCNFMRCPQVIDVGKYFD